MNNEIFDEWNEIKKELDGSKQGYVKAGKIYWLSVGRNIGTEIYGKGDKFLRPVLVVKTSVYRRADKLKDQKQKRFCVSQIYRYRRQRASSATHANKAIWHEKSD